MAYFISFCLMVFNQVVWSSTVVNPGGINHGELLRIVSGLVCVLIIILVLSWLVKRMNGLNLTSSKGFQYVGSMILGPKEKVVLIKAGARYLLIGVGAASINVLHDFGVELPDGFDAENKSTFADALKSAIGKK